MSRSVPWSETIPPCVPGHDWELSHGLFESQWWCLKCDVAGTPIPAWQVAGALFVLACGSRLEGVEDAPESSEA